MDLREDWSEDVRQLVGARLQRTRIQQGLSIRTVSQRADLSKTTVVAVEAGRASRQSTYLKMAETLGLHLDVLMRENPAAGLPFAVHRGEDDEWFDLTGFAQGPLPLDAQKSAERRGELVREGISPLNILRSRLEGGRIKATIIEVAKGDLFKPENRAFDENRSPDSLPTRCLAERARTSALYEHDNDTVVLIGSGPGVRLPISARPTQGWHRVRGIDPGRSP